MFGGSVGVEELSGNIDYIVAVPEHGKSRFFGHSRYYGSFKVLIVSQLAETVNVFFRHNHSHPLLGLADCEFGAIQPFILFRHFIQIYHKAVGQFAYGHRNTAGSEIVAAPDQP